MLPNFIYIGPDKAGSTWLFEVMSWHPQVYMASAKDICFFDWHFNKGVDWYERHFDGVADEAIVGEVSHNYLFSQSAPVRIQKTLSKNIKLMVCLREPTERAFSAYLYLLKHGLYTKDFESALEEVPELIEHGRYATHVGRYLEVFDRDRIYVANFDDLKADSAQFAQDLFAELGIAPLEPPSSLQGKTLPAARSRSVVVSRFLKQLAIWARKIGLVRLVGAVKHSSIINKLLYRPYPPSQKPQPKPKTVEYLRRLFFQEVHDTDQMLGTDFLSHWNYSKEPTSNVSSAPNKS